MSMEVQYIKLLAELSQRTCDDGIIWDGAGDGHPQLRLVLHHSVHEISALLLLTND